MDAVFSCMWEQGLNMGDPGVIAQALNDAGLPAQDVITGSQDPEVKLALIENSNASVERGCFGAPTFFVNDEIFFGKDRLREVEEEILSARL